MHLVCVLCCVLATAWCTRIAIEPMWIGRFHLPAHGDSTGWIDGGIFAVKDGTPASARAPLWAPPPPHADNIQATVRLPWQQVTRGAHIEIDVSAWIRAWAFAIGTIGAVLGVAQFVLDRRTHRGVVTVWCSVAVALAVAWLALSGMELVTFGAATNLWSLEVFGSAAALGLVVGFVRHRRARARAMPPEDVRTA